MKIQKGAQLGLSRYSSMEGIHIIPTSNGDTTTVGIHILNKLNNDNGVQVEYLAKFKMMPIYYSLEGMLLGYDPACEKDCIVVSIQDYFRVPISSFYDLSKSKDQVVIIKEFTPTTIVKLTRVVGGVTREVTERFSMREAIEAGLYKGMKLDKTLCTGKSNWNNYPAKHVDHRAKAFASRDIIADVLAKGGTIYVEGEIE
jgi:hypothetical protein